MKVVCPYCDSYIDANETMNCPKCGGSVSAAVKEAEERMQREAAEQREAEAALQKKQEEDERDMRFFEIVLAALTGFAGLRRGRGLIRLISNLISRGKKGGSF